MRAAPWRVVLGDRVRAARRGKRWSRRRAEGASGVPASTWQNIEAGREVRDYSLIRVAEALGWDRGECFRIIADALDE